MSELISLLDLTATLSSSALAARDPGRRAAGGDGGAAGGRGCLLRARRGRRATSCEAARGLPADAPAAGRAGALVQERGRVPGCRPRSRRVPRAPSGSRCSARSSRRARGGGDRAWGARADGRPYGPEETAFLRSVAACAATPIENGLIYDELRQVNQRLSVKVFQLHNLFDISRELTASFDEETIKNLVTTTLMGHLLVSRCALYRRARTAWSSPTSAASAAKLARRPSGESESARCGRPARAHARRRPARRGRSASAWPARACAGRAAVAGRAGPGLPGRRGARGRRAFTEEDRDFAQTLARQAVAALESVRLPPARARAAAPGQGDADRARDPAEPVPAGTRRTIPGFEIAARADPCYRWAATTTTSSPCPARRPGPRHRRRLGQGHARQHPHGLRARLAARAGRHRGPARGRHGAREPVPLREHAGHQVRHRLLRGAGPALRAGSPT